ncbi:MAG: LD-carboxypeptidase [Clostridia bacterium]|nr:LD-carboxypeptidase [Clostridia bacterium]
MLQPKKLFPGARIALIGTSGPLPEGRLEPTLEALRALELEPVVFESAISRHGYLSGTDDLRVRDLNAAFQDDSIQGVLCIRGGYGAHRLMSGIDFDMIRCHPKLFGGYSDVTALNIAFNELCDMMTYHIIMPSTEYYKPVDEYSMDYLKRALFGSLAGPVENPADRPPMETITPGKARGRLCGGNLSLVQQSVGTPWAIDTKDKILFLEDIGEKPYRVDAMLTQLKNSGKLSDCAGIVLGYWTDCQAEDPAKSLSLDTIFDEIIKPLGIPAVKGLCCGHDLPTCALPLGAMVSLDADACTLVIEEG